MTPDRAARSRRLSSDGVITKNFLNPQRNPQVERESSVDLPVPPCCRIRPDLGKPDQSEMPDIRKHQPPSRPHSIAAGPKPGAVQQWAVWAEEVERLLEQGKSKPAVELAKRSEERRVGEGWWGRRGGG